ncbi:DUF6286 domain-containing protein [Streptomyces sp. NPDC001919]
MRGITRVSEKALRAIAVGAASEALSAGSSAQRLTARLRGHSAHLSLEVRLHRPESLTEAVAGLQDHVARRTGQLTGLPCERPGVRVTRLTLPVPRPPDLSEGVEEGAARVARRPRRCWSQRRGPMAVLALAGSLLLGTLALDIAGFPLHGRPLTAWWRAGVTWTADHGFGPLLFAFAAGAAVGLAVLLILLALLPGHRGRWTVSSGPALTSTVDRKVTEGLLRDAVGAVEGIGHLRVRMNRRTATVRATLMFGDRETALAEAQGAAQQAMTACRLVRPPRLRVVVDTIAPPAVQAKPEPHASSTPAPDPDPDPDPREHGKAGPSRGLDPGPTPGPDPARPQDSDGARFGAPRRPKDDSPTPTIRQGAES